MQRPTCNYWTYSPWVISSTDSNYITRTILTSSPDWCIGGISVTTQERPTCTSWTYSDWSGCSNGSKTRQILTASPDWCIGGNPDILSSCCSPKNCAELGADCGTVDDGCGNILTCNNSCKAPTPSCIQNKCVGCASDANCQTGYYCSTWASSMLSCNPNAASNTCQKKCWSMDYTSKYITFFEGDDLYGYTCAAIPIDNPKCDGTFPTCPGQCPTRSTIGSGTDTNKCHYSGLCLPLLTCWAPRTEYSCSDISKKTLYYQNACSYISGNVLKYGQVNAYGQCI
jgi:hypothetical protein